MNGEKTQIEQIEESSFGKDVDWVLFSFGTLLLSLVVAMIVIFPDFSAASINRLYQNVTSQFGVLYVFIAITLLIFLLSVAISKHGNVVLGNTNKLAYSHFSWAAMLFCAGVAGGKGSKRFGAPGTALRRMPNCTCCLILVPLVT